MDRRAPNERPVWLKPDNSYDLLVPVDFSVGGEPNRLERLQLRRLTGAEMLIMDEPIPYTEKLFKMIGNMTEHPRVVLMKFDAVDLDRIDDILGYFREPGSVTGAIS